MIGKFGSKTRDIALLYGVTLGPLRHA